MTSLRSWILIVPWVVLAGCNASSAIDSDGGSTDSGPLEPCTEPGTYDVYIENLVSECGTPGPVDTALPMDIPPPMVAGPKGCVVLDWMQTGACAWQWRTRCTGGFMPMPPIEGTIEIEARGGRIEGSYTSSVTDESGAVCHSSGVLSTRDE